MKRSETNAPAVVKTPPRNRIVRFTGGDLLLMIILGLFAVVIIYPFYNTILVSIVPQTDYARSPLMLWPKRITWESYEFVFKSPILLRSMGTSALLMLVGTLYNMLLTVTLA